MSIDLRGIVKRFGSFVAVNDVSLRVADGELLALLGPSGSGKTTLLRIVAGLEQPDEGSVWFDAENSTSRSARERKVGFVFQHYALFRNMTVFENVAFGLRVRPRRLRPPERELRERIQRLLELVQIHGLAGRYPSQLSGGQRQRVALARALAVEPRVLLLDEPFGALDAKVRRELRRWLRRLHRELQVTSIFVTHDQDEALELADRVVVMNEGRVEQIGTPDDVYHRPSSRFVYGFLGDVNHVRRPVLQGKAVMGTLKVDAASATEGTEASVYLRPHALEVTAAPNGAPYFRAKICHINSAGPVVRLELITEWGDLLRAELPHDRFDRTTLTVAADVCVTPRGADVFIEEPQPAV